jgi:hypothetical protein
MRILLPALLLATSFAAALPATADDGMVGLKPEQIGHIFCLSRLGSDEGPITGLLTPELTAAIDDAWTKNDAWAAANPPDDKPPLGDGIPWQSYPDYAAQCTVGLVTLMKTDAKIEIAYGFPDAPDADFTDTLLLKRVANDEIGLEQWRIDNVAYATGGDLKASLVATFDNP